MKNYWENLAKYRLSVSKERIAEAKLLLENRQYGGSVSRSYYAMFSAAKAILATKELNSKTHSGIISLFNLHFVKNGMVSKDLGKVLGKAKKIREESDYGEFVTVTKEEAEKQLENAERFIKEIEKTLKEVLGG